jgi:hypothetical protein
VPRTAEGYGFQFILEADWLITGEPRTLVMRPRTPGAEEEREVGYYRCKEKRVVAFLRMIRGVRRRTNDHEWRSERRKNEVGVESLVVPWDPLVEERAQVREGRSRGRPARRVQEGYLARYLDIE